MHFQLLKGKYDVIISLGHNCLVADQLSRHMLRNVGGVLDWMESPLLCGVSNLLRNRFAHFMESANLSITGVNQTAGCYIVRDAAYHIFSHHDFPLTDNAPGRLASFPELRVKIERRVPRFINALATARRLLFIRTDTTLTETAELLSVLGGMVSGSFNVLVINHSPVLEIEEEEWQFDNVSVLKIPQVQDMFLDNNRIWSNILSGFQVN